MYLLYSFRHRSCIFSVVKESLSFSSCFRSLKKNRFSVQNSFDMKSSNSPNAVGDSRISSISLILSRSLAVGLPVTSRDTEMPFEDGLEGAVRSAILSIVDCLSNSKLLDLLQTS